MRPRSAPAPSAALASLVSQLWPAAAGAGPVRIRYDDAPEPGHRLVERYLVLPSLQRARFLVPLGARAASTASVRAYNSLRPVRTRLVRDAVGALVAAGAAPHACRGRLAVWLRTTVGRDDDPDYLLLGRLARELGTEVLAGVGIRPDAPNSKPTLQLFTAAGRPVAYVKVGWNDSTRRQVVNEATALTALTPGLRVLKAPALLCAGDWASRRYVATAPLPSGIRRHGPHGPPGARISVDIASAGGGIIRDGAATTRLLGGLRDRATTVAASEPALGAALLHSLSSCRDVTPLSVGSWHGDWVAWNVGRRAGELHAWDWEHNGTAAPLGFDALHWTFQEQFIRLERPLGDALTGLSTRAAEVLVDLGVPVEQHRHLVVLYAVEMALRAAEMRAGGAGWNDRFYPAVIGLLPSLADC